MNQNGTGVSLQRAQRKKLVKSKSNVHDNKIVGLNTGLIIPGQ
jgi:hypothetical protein